MFSLIPRKKDTASERGAESDALATQPTCAACILFWAPQLHAYQYKRQRFACCWTATMLCRCSCTVADHLMKHKAAFCAVIVRGKLECKTYIPTSHVRPQSQYKKHKLLNSIIQHTGAAYPLLHHTATRWFLCQEPDLIAVRLQHMQTVVSQCNAGTCESRSNNRLHPPIDFSHHANCFRQHWHPPCNLRLVEPALQALHTATPTQCLQVQQLP